MWPFGPHAPMQEPELSPEMKKRLDELGDRTAAVEKGLKGLVLDWDEWFDKFRLMYARLSKRIRDSQAQAAETEAEETRQDAPGRTIAPPPSPGYHPPGYFQTGDLSGKNRRRNY